MRHFLFEFITGGGLSAQHLPKALVNEGEMMVQTLLSELIGAGYSEILLCRDERIELIGCPAEQQIIEQQTITTVLPALIAKADVAWLIAPETDHCLFSLADLFIKQSTLFIGCNPKSIKISTSKLLTNKILAEAKIKTVETQAFNTIIPPSTTGWILKPDDGVAAEHCYFIGDHHELSKVLTTHKDNNLIIQPYLKGEAVSMSLLVFNEEVRLLACNKQYIEIKEDTVRLVAIGVNECFRYKNQMLALAKKIVKAISGFAGYIGIDMIKYNNEYYVLDINPRLTTAYAGLSESLGCNVTMAILNTFLNRRLPDIDLNQAVSVRVEL